MNLMKFGYKKEEIQIRKMTMAELRLGVVQELLKKNYRYAEIRLVLEIAIHCLVIYQTYVLWIKRQNAIDIS